MRTNDQTLLDELLERRRVETAPELTPQQFLEIFAASEILKDFDLTYEEIESGITDGGGDGGIDALYTFINGDLLQDDTVYSNLKKDISISLNIIQSKSEDGFKEGALEKLRYSLKELLDLSTSTSSLKTVYNEDLLQVVELFKDCYRSLSPLFPKLEINICYAAKATDPHPNVSRKASKLKDEVQQLFSDSTVNVRLLGAKDLLTLARRSPTVSFQLSLAENPISTGSAGFVCLAKLKDYNVFISDDGGKLKTDLFEANVRDYQGNTPVNKEIQSSLRSSNEEDFWWLNNGVTVLASEAVLSGKILTIKNPQIVNGQQTSREVNEYFQNSKVVDDKRNVLVRVLVPKDPASTDRIIKATNSQTAIPAGSLRATDKIQRDIEDYFATKGLYYDRRRNFYKNNRKPLVRIVTIKYVAQAVTAILLQLPHDARSRPSSLLRETGEYGRIFSPGYPLELFHFCTAFLRRMDSALKSMLGLESRDRKFLRFHVAMFAAAKLAGTAAPKADVLAKLDPNSLDTKLLSESIDGVRKVYMQQGGNDRVAKTRAFTDALKLAIAEGVSSGHPPKSKAAANASKASSKKKKSDSGGLQG